MDIEKARQLVKEQLTQKRFDHTLRVTDTAVELAKHYNINVTDVTLAALLHDYAKDMNENRLRSSIGKFNLPKDLLTYDVELWHGPVAASVFEQQYKLENKDIIHAIYYHTTGRANMSMTELIVFVADYIEPARSFPGVDAVRDIAAEDIRLAAREALKNTIIFLLNKQVTIHPNTFLAYNDLTKVIGVN